MNIKSLLKISLLTLVGLMALALLSACSQQEEQQRDASTTGGIAA